MSLIYVTGAPGSGKSTALELLKRRGFVAYGTDEHGVSQWIDRQTGEVSTYPEGYDLHEWYRGHEWTLSPQKVSELRGGAEGSGHNIYLFGVAAGLEDVQHNFGQLIVLIADESTLKQRINDRKDSSFGKDPHELQIILEWQGKHLPGYQKQGALTIDTSELSPDEVADAIIKNSEAPSNN